MSERRGRPLGLFGRPYLDLARVLDLAPLDAIDAEIARGLARVDDRYTGGTLKWMGVVAPWAMDDAYRDAMHVIEALPDAELASLLLARRRPRGCASTGPRELPLRRRDRSPVHPRAGALAAYRHGVYFPWKVCYHLLENERWEDKHSGDGKASPTRRGRCSPRPSRILESLPFAEIGRARDLRAPAERPRAAAPRQRAGRGARRSRSRSRSARAATSASTCRTTRATSRWWWTRAPTGSTTWTTTACSPTRSSATRSASTACSSRTSCATSSARRGGRAGPESAGAKAECAARRRHLVGRNLAAREPRHL